VSEQCVCLAATMYCPASVKVCTKTEQCMNCPENSEVYVKGALKPGHGASSCASRCYCNRNYFEVGGDGDWASAMTCQPCPAGGDCDDAKLNFTSLASKPGYWQIKPWFASTPTSFFYSRCTEKIRCRNAINDWNNECTESSVSTRCATFRKAMEAGCVCQGSSRYSFKDGDGCREGHNGPFCSTCRAGWVMDSTTRCSTSTD
jgi:hypothetical protein